MSKHEFAEQRLSAVKQRIQSACLASGRAQSEVTLIGASKKGSIQSNKTKQIAQHFNWVHGIDRFKIAQRLANQNPHPHAIKALIQINPDHELSKAGVSLAEAAELADAIAQIDKLELHGFMMIPMPRDKQSEQRRVFAKAKELLETTNQQYGLNLKHLSMGMSGDLESAIAEGSTMIRIGTDLFGARA